MNQLQLFDMADLWLEGDAQQPPSDDEYLAALADLRRLYGPKVFDIPCEELALPTRRHLLASGTLRIHPQLTPSTKSQWAPPLSVIYRRDGGRRQHPDVLIPGCTLRLSEAPDRFLDLLLRQGSAPAPDLATLNTWALWCLSELPKCRHRPLVRLITMFSSAWSDYQEWQPSHGHESAVVVLRELLAAPRSTSTQTLDPLRVERLLSVLPDKPLWQLTMDDVSMDPYWAQVVGDLWLSYGIHLPTRPTPRMFALHLPRGSVRLPAVVFTGLRWLLHGQDTGALVVHEALANLRVSHLPHDAYSAVPDLGSWSARGRKGYGFSERQDVAPIEVMEALRAWRVWARTRGADARVINPEHVRVLSLTEDPLAPPTMEEIASVVAQVVGGAR